MDKTKIFTKNSNKAEILGYPVSIAKPEEILNFAEEKIINKQSCNIITLNPEMIMHAFKNPELDKILKTSDLSVPDGIGIIIALKYYGYKNISRLPGIELSSELINLCSKRNYTIGLLGAEEEVVNLAAQNIAKKYPGINIAFKHNGYFKNESEITEQIKSADPQVLFVALGAPKQEIFIEKYKNLLNSCVMIGVGGSFDIWAEKVKRAPVSFRNLGLEWLYRLITQPSRFSRIFPALPIFFIKVFMYKKLPEFYRLQNNKKTK